MIGPLSEGDRATFERWSCTCREVIAHMSGVSRAHVERLSCICREVIVYLSGENRTDIRSCRFYAPGLYTLLEKTANGGILARRKSRGRYLCRLCDHGMASHHFHFSFSFSIFHFARSRSPNCSATLKRSTKWTCRFGWTVWVKLPRLWVQLSSTSTLL